MFRTPSSTVKTYGSSSSPRSAEKAGRSPALARRRISFGDDNPSASQDGPATPGTRRAAADASRQLKGPNAGYPSRTAEARACLSKAKVNLGNSRNLRTDIKTAVLEAINRLFELVKESERERAPAAPTAVPVSVPAADRCPESDSECLVGQTELVKTMKEHISLIKENSDELVKLRASLANRETVVETTYASAAAATKSHTGAQALERTTLHSVVVSSTQETDTSDEVLERVRKAVDAKEGWVRVERVRKAKDQKVIMGCETREERQKIKARLEAAGVNLVVEEVKNRDPLLILRDVLLIHNDEEVLRALRNQNREIFHGLDDKEQKMSVKFRRKTRNPHANHVVLAVTPTIWRRAIEVGKLRVDLQRVRVEDQTPLVQCTRCLAYGHGKRLCTEPADLCSHCGGPHLRVDCPVRQIGEAAVCVNCTRAKLGATEHNAFYNECPVRRKWDAFARASIAYC